MPLQLTITVLILGITVPIILAATGEGEVQVLQAETAQAMNALATGASEAFVGENQTTVTVAINVPAGVTITVGDDLFERGCAGPVPASAYRISGLVGGNAIAHGVSLVVVPHSDWGSIPMTATGTSLCTSHPLVIGTPSTISFEKLWESVPGESAGAYLQVAFAQSR